MPAIYGWLIAFAVIGVQFYLSRRSPILLGAILPVIYIAFISVWFFKRFGEEDTLSLILAAVGGLAFLLSIWIEGRNFLKKQRQKELKKIQLQDM
ncbi:MULTISPECIES: hypothetical protein [Mesobacillus]|uniref:Uncharacterized protein n=1 Tax=Mesobacillus selenatarsenatis TaxID=388741 RepID=A0A846TK88_9BACI|nr:MULTISPECIES: hypothetical protein [Mesobacillus]NKE05797.1 hypothetical protein [Mesobacillus selenatarsenatis]